jgi:hypothetical protein
LVWLVTVSISPSRLASSRKTNGGSRSIASFHRAVSSLQVSQK